jgi:hypothetical protein
MDRKMPRPGEIYDHFKDKPYQIITVALDSETGEKMVVYQALYGDFKTYVRPLVMFMSEVDHDKYPEIMQKYRFEHRTIVEDTGTDNIKTGSTGVQYVIKPEDTAGQKAVINSDAAAPSNQMTSTETLKEEVLDNTTEGEVNLLLMKFLDAESYSKKLEVLTSNKKHLTDRLITDMAVALDLAVDEGPLDQRVSGLINCLQAMCRFENRRLR